MLSELQDPPPRRVRTVVFDLDDTLLETTPAYERILDRFAGEVARALPGAAGHGEIRALQEEIDVRAVERMGFAKARFPWSLAETYRVLAARAGRAPDPGLEARLVALGHEVFARVPELVAGARALLDDLRGRFELLLYTLGVPEVQRVKVEHHGLERVFHEVHIVLEKSRAALAGVIGARPPSEVMVVGDSLRGEIGPALELGCRAVLVRRAVSWRYHAAEVTGPYEAIDEIGAVRDLLGAP